MERETAWRIRGEAFCAAKDFIQAEKCFRDACQAFPQDATAHYNLGVVLVYLRRYAEALACFSESLKCNPQLAAAYSNVGFCLTEMGRVDLARQAFAAAHHVAPEDPMPVLNEGVALLTLGNFHEGWMKFEARWQRRAATLYRPQFDQPIWRGEDLSGKTILLLAEEGFGDTLQMARYIPLLQQRAARVVVVVQPALIRLFQSLPPEVTVIPQGNVLPDFDFYVPMLSVPIGFKTDVATIPAFPAYLAAPHADITRWAQRLSGLLNKKVGLVWAGRSSHERDHHRSIPLSQFESLLSIKNITWVSLQHAIAPHDQALFTRQGGLVLTGKFDDFADTAAVIMNLDLVICVDTATAHLAAALGKTVWLLLPFAADWRWLLHRNDSPWYPSMRIYRQLDPDNWLPVIHCIADALRDS